MSFSSLNDLPFFYFYFILYFLFHAFLLSLSLSLSLLFSLSLPLFLSFFSIDLLICLLSLIIIRIIQNKVVNHIKLEVENKWVTGLSGARIQEALNKWTVYEITNGYYRFNDIDDKDLKLILNSFNINIPLKLFKKMELLNIKTSIKVI